jgi:hypothetical protein
MNLGNEREDGSERDVSVRRIQSTYNLHEAHDNDDASLAVSKPQSFDDMDEDRLAVVGDMEGIKAGGMMHAAPASVEKHKSKRTTIFGQGRRDSGMVGGLDAEHRKSWVGLVVGKMKTAKTKHA